MGTGEIVENWTGWEGRRDGCACALTLTAVSCSVVLANVDANGNESRALRLCHAFGGTTQVNSFMIAIHQGYCMDISLLYYLVKSSLTGSRIGELSGISLNADIVCSSLLIF